MLFSPNYTPNISRGWYNNLYSVADTATNTIFNKFPGGIATKYPAVRELYFVVKLWQNFLNSSPFFCVHNNYIISYLHPPAQRFER